MEASNVRAMYDALVKVKRLFDGQIMFQPSIREAHKAVNAALAAPPRNCDVGTAEEQHARFYNFCDKIEECKECPLWRGGGLTSKCSVYWGQMPYEEGGEK